MYVPGRLVSLGTVGALAALSAAFGLWSGLSSPAVADVQLHDAAANTLAASGFVVSMQATVRTNTVQSSGSVQPSQVVGIHLQVDYERPNRFRVDETVSGPGSFSTQVHLTQIGSSCWGTFPQSAGQIQITCDPDLTEKFLTLLGALEHTSGAQYKDGTFLLRSEDDLPFVNAIGSSSSTEERAVKVKDSRVEARISGNSVSWESVSYVQVLSLTVGIGLGASGVPVTQGIQERFDVVIEFSHVGTAQAVARPAGPPQAVG